MYNNPYAPAYMNNYNQQNISERIDNQIAQLQQMKEQMKSNQQPAINQTFQLAPTNTHVMRYANTIDDVMKENVYYDTPFFSKDMSVLWLKNAKGDIKTYELSEIIPQDAKDMQIELLQSQIDALKEEIRQNDANVTNASSTKDTTDTKRDDEPTRTATKKSKSTSV